LFKRIGLLTKPVKDDIASALMSKLKLSATLIRLAEATEHQKSLLGLLQVGVVLANEGWSGILGPRLVDLY
jgi:hypothetical protein